MNRSINPRGRMAGDRGAIVIQAALAMVVLLGFGAFVFDGGLLTLARAQAQHAADAAALAGAIAHAYDGADQATTRMWAEELVAVHPVGLDGIPAGRSVTFGCPGDTTSPGPCVTVTVHRDALLGSTPLPVFLSSVFGRTSQAVRAMATARVFEGNGTNCLKPWAIPDRWLEFRPVPKATWDPPDLFEAYVESGPGIGTGLVPPDQYLPPPGGMFNIPFDGGGGGDLGRPLTLRVMNPEATPPITAPEDRIAPGSLLPLQLPTGTYEQNIATCNGSLVALEQQIATGTTAMQGATSVEFENLIELDEDASWNAATNDVEGSCAPDCAAVSPRLVVLALFDPERYQRMRSTGDWSECGGGRCIKVVNLVGFFLDSMVGGDVFGYVARHPGLLSLDHPTVTGVSSFLPAITLIR